MWRRCLVQGFFIFTWKILATESIIILFPEQGEIDFTAIFRALDSIGYEEFVTVELYTYSENPREAAEKAFNYLRTYFRMGL